MSVIAIDSPTPHQRVDPGTLQRHLAATYFALRIGLAAIALGLPLLLTLYAKLRFGVHLQGSLSAYYHATPGGGTDAARGVARDLFVGALVAASALLYLYKGFSRAEDVALNLAGLFLATVAFVPMPWGCGDACPQVTVHGVAAVLFFLCIAYVSWFRAPDTLTLIDDPKRAARYGSVYRALALLMAVSPLAAFALNLALRRSSLILFVEWFGVWVFGAYWLTKTRELYETDAELLALAGEAARVVSPRANRPDAAAILRVR